MFCILLLTSPEHAAQSTSSLLDKLHLEPVYYNHVSLDGIGLEISHITQDHEGYFWLGTTEGVFVFDGHHAVNFTQLLRDHLQLDLPSGIYRMALRDEYGQIWLSSVRGLYIFSTRQHTLSEVDMETTDFTNPLMSQVFFMRRNRDHLYVCTWLGFYVMDMKSLKMIDHYLWEQKYIHPILNRNSIQSIYPDLDNKIVWGSSNLGIFRVNRETGKVEIFPMSPEDDITGRVVPDRYFFYQGVLHNQYIVFPTYDSGVTYFDTLSKSYHSYLVDPMLRGPRSVDNKYTRLKSLLPYSEDEVVVLSHNYGIGSFDLNSHEYSFSLSPKRYGFEHSMMIDRHRHIRFQKAKTSQPIDSLVDSIKYKLEFISIQTTDSIYHLPGILGTPDQIYLPHDRNYLQVYFGVVDYPGIDSVDYEYKLNNDPWTELGNENKLVVPSVNSRDNRLHIRARHATAIIDEAGFSFKVNRPFYTTVWFYLLVSISLAILMSVFWNWRAELKRNREKEKIQLENRVYKMEARKLRNQLNPHFIFNSLNAIRNMIHKGDLEGSDIYLNNFSRFIRKVLNHSEIDHISLEEEIELCRQYLEIEQLRFDGGFQYDIQYDQSLPLDFIQVPSLLFQPILENSVWHGLLHKNGMRRIDMVFVKNEHGVLCILEDNGVGRKQNLIKLKVSRRESFGLRLFEERLQLYNMVYQTNYSYKIIDKVEDGHATGTRFEIQLEL